MERTLVVKLGGSTLGGHSGTKSPETTLEDLLKLTANGWGIVVVHGGGNATSELLRRMGEEPRFLNGLRVTDAAALQAATMMIRGQINTELVESFNRASLKFSGNNTRPVLAQGMSGVDGCMLESRRERRFGDIGYVGEVVKVNTAPLTSALKAGQVPIVSPLGYSLDADARTFNLNADTAAAAIAAAMKADATVFLTDVPGVLDENKHTIRRLGVRSSQNLIKREIITGGMIPKVEAALKALEGSKRVMVIDGRQPAALYNAVENYQPIGTTFLRRMLMQVDIPHEIVTPPIPEGVILDTAPTDEYLLGPVLHQGYIGTVDFDWKDETEAIEIIRKDMNPGWGQFLPEASVGAFHDNRIIGLCQVIKDYEEGNRPCLTNVCVLPEYRGRRIGIALIQECLRRLYLMNFKQAILRVTIGNEAAFNIYRRAGFYQTVIYDI
jgi:acetylglutamate kinase